jgi:hypothetical protein
MYNDIFPLPVRPSTFGSLPKSTIFFLSAVRASCWIHRLWYFPLSGLSNGRRQPHRSRHLQAPSTTTTAQDTDTKPSYPQSDSDSVSLGRKKSSMQLSGHDDEEHGDEFWMGRSAGKKRQETQAGNGDTSPAAPQYRVQALMSPPPSRRQTTAHHSRVLRRS